MNLIKDLYECIQRQNLIIALPYDRSNYQDILQANEMLVKAGYVKFKDYDNFGLFSYGV